MEENNQSPYQYENQHGKLMLFVQQSENCKLIFGKVTIQVKKQMHPIKMIIEMKGIYRIWDVTKDATHEYHEQSKVNIDINLNQPIQTITSFEQVDTLRNQKHKINPNCKIKLQRQQLFLQGMQKIAQLGQHQDFKPEQKYNYPFIFNVPNKLPHSLNDVCFGGKRIQIKYYIKITALQKQQQSLITTTFDIPIRQNPNQLKPPSTYCHILKYNCFTKFFCKCLGSYHFQLNSITLHPGQIQIQGRAFRQGKKTQDIIHCIYIQLKGQLKNVKTLVIAQKKMFLKFNQYQMLEGQVLLSFDPQLKSFQSQLITIRFWIACNVQFKSNIWKIKRKDVSVDIMI